MKTKHPFHLEDQLKILKTNLEQGANLFTTDEGRRAYYRSLLIEIHQISLTLGDCLNLIHDNLQLFPTQSFYQTNFELENKNLLDWEHDHREDVSWPPEIFTELDNLRHLLQQAGIDIESPSFEQMQLIYQLRWNNFYNRKWQGLKGKVETQIIACLPSDPAMRQQVLQQRIDEKRNALTNHPLGQQLANQGISFDEYSHNGHLVETVVAPNLFNCRKALGNNNKVYEFFTLYMTYNMLLEERDKIHLDHNNQIHHELDKWFLDLSHKLGDDVKPDFAPRFDDLIVELCHHPDLYECLKKSSLRSQFNLKLAYNLFGIMIGEKVFMTNAIDPLRSKITTTKTNPYFTYDKYSKYGSSYSELNAHLLEVAKSIIANWKAMAA